MVIGDIGDIPIIDYNLYFVQYDNENSVRNSR